MKLLKVALLGAGFLSGFFLMAQETDTTTIEDRFFAPSLQMGYMANRTDQLSGGLLIQTSVEYRTTKNWFFRLNYDDVDFDFELKQLEGLTGSFSGNVAFSEFLLGAGFRGHQNSHAFFALVQPGLRLYSFPLISNQDNNLSIDFEDRSVSGPG